jgi:hypothetical protein
MIDASTVRLLVPDDNCSLDLTVDAVNAHRVVLIGDSVFAGIQERIEAADPSLLLSAARDWSITAVSGFGWSASSPSWPLAKTGTWAIGLARGFFAAHPTALVVELGADDALRAVFADVTRPELADTIHAAVSNNIEELLRESHSAGVPCTVLVTAPAHPTSMYGADQRYATEATEINRIISASAAGAPGRVVVADWATLSASHHGVTRNWFLPDNVHPNTTGERALIALVHRAVQSCQR